MQPRSTPSIFSVTNAPLGSRSTGSSSGGLGEIVCGELCGDNLPRQFQENSTSFRRDCPRALSKSMIHRMLSWLCDCQTSVRWRGDCYGSPGAQGSRPPSRGAAGAPRSRGSCRCGLDAPVAGPALLQLAENRRSATVIVPDATRKIRLAALIPAVMERLQRGGDSGSAITVLVACGTHPASGGAEIENSLGPCPWARNWWSTTAGAMRTSSTSGNFALEFRSDSTRGR